MKKKLDEKTYEIAFRDGVIQMRNLLDGYESFNEIETLLRDLPIDYDDRARGWSEFLTKKAKVFIKDS